MHAAACLNALGSSDAQHQASNEAEWTRSSPLARCPARGTIWQCQPALPSRLGTTQQAFEAGGALVYLHVHNPDERASSVPVLSPQLQEGVATHCVDIIIQFSPGGCSPVAWGKTLELKLPMALLSAASVIFQPFDAELMGKRPDVRVVIGGNLQRSTAIFIESGQDHLSVDSWVNSNFQPHPLIAGQHRTARDAVFRTWREVLGAAAAARKPYRLLLSSGVVVSSLRNQAGDEDAE